MPWPEFANRRLNLIIDSGQPDIERIASRGFGAGPVGRWQRLLFSRQRRRDGRQGQMLWLSSNGSDVARGCVITDEWPDTIRQWVQVAQREGLVFERVVSASTLLASSIARDSNPLLFVTECSGLTRHTVCADRAVCLSREIDSQEDPVDAVTASLAHMAERWGFYDVDVSLPPSSCLWNEDAISRITTSDKAHIVQRALLPAEHRLSEAGVSDSLMLSLHQYACSPFHLAWQSRCCRALSDSYAAAGREANQLREMFRTQSMAAISLGVALLFVTYAGLQGMEHAQQAAANNRDRGSILSALEAMKVEALGLDEEPDETARIVERAVMLEQDFPLPNDQLLQLIARVVTAHPNIVLDGIAWRVVAGEIRVGDDVLFRDGAMSAKEPAWATGALDSQPSGRDLLQLLEVRGRVESGENLGATQLLAETFFAGLKAAPGIERCVVLESPLTKAIDGPRDVRAVVRTWRIRCLVNSEHVDTKAAAST